MDSAIMLSFGTYNTTGEIFALKKCKTNISIQCEPVVDAAGDDDHVAGGDRDADPMVLAIAHVEVSGTSQHKPGTLQFII